MKPATGPFESASPSAPPSAGAVLKKHGKSFQFAGNFLTRAAHERCARLYRFCRYLDDISDESTDAVWAAQQLEQIEVDLLKRDHRDPVVSDFLNLAQECEFAVQPAVELVRGVRGDLAEVEIRDETELKRYTYRVAGTVGLMMCGVLGVKDAAALPYAIDLGMAMQLTNIARDVSKDAQIGRRYLPRNFFASAPAHPALAAGHPEVREDIRDAVRWLLNEADRYYRSGVAGLAYLPPRARLGILVAARVYQAIGQEIARQDFAVWEGRAIVSPSKKIVIAARALGYFSWHRGLRRKPLKHDADLHQHLTGLASADVPKRNGSET